MINAMETSLWEQVSKTAGMGCMEASMEQQSSEMHEWYKKKMVVCIEKSNKTRHLGNHHGMLNPNGRATKQAYFEKGRAEKTNSKTE